MDRRYVQIASYGSDYGKYDSVRVFIFTHTLNGQRGPIRGRYLSKNGNLTYDYFTSPFKSIREAMGILKQSFEIKPVPKSFNHPWQDNENYKNFYIVE